MLTRLRTILIVLAVGLMAAAPATAQTYVRLYPVKNSGTLSATGDAVTLTSTRDQGALGLTIVATGFTGTITPQCSNDDGTTWTAIRMTPPNSTTAVTSMTAGGQWNGSIAGCQRVRAYATLVTAGSVVVTLNATPAGGGGGGGGADMTTVESLLRVPAITSKTCTVAAADYPQTNTACVSVSAGTRIVVTYAQANCGAAVTGQPGIRVGFATATLASAAVSGAAGVFLESTGVSGGGGVGFVGPVVGASDEDVRFTFAAAPTGGSCSIVVTYYTEAS